jgi:hypothetical protein
VKVSTKWGFKNGPAEDTGLQKLGDLKVNFQTAERNYTTNTKITMT